MKRNVPAVPFSKQSIPSRGLFSLSWRDFTSASVLIGGRPLFSASARGIDSRASAKALIAYCSREDVYKVKYIH